MLETRRVRPVENVAIQGMPVRMVWQQIRENLGNEFQHFEVDSWTPAVRVPTRVLIASERRATIRLPCLLSPRTG